MLQANISTTKNKLSSYLKRVKQGEAVLIIEREEPIAILSPYQVTKLEKRWHHRIATLSKNGRITLPKNVRKKKLKQPLITKKPAKLVQALLEERVEGR